MSGHDAYVAEAARTLGLELGPYVVGVNRYFALAAEMAAVVDAYPLAAHDESIETFVPTCATPSSPTRRRG